MSADVKVNVVVFSKKFPYLSMLIFNDQTFQLEENSLLWEKLYTLMSQLDVQRLDSDR